MEEEKIKEKQDIGEINEKHEVKKKIIRSNDINQLYEHNQKIFEYIKNNKGTIYIKNQSKNFNIKINNESFCKIYKNTGLSIDNLSNYLVNTIYNETTVEYASTELYDDNNEKIYQIIKSRNEFPVILAEDNVDNEDNEDEGDNKPKKKIILKSKSIKNILSKIGSLNDTITYIQISLTQISIDYDSTNVITQYTISRYKMLMDANKMFYVLFNSIKKEDKKSEKYKFPVSSYSIQKIMDLAEKDDNKKENYLKLSLLNEEDKEKIEQENNEYLEKITIASENYEVIKEFKENEEENVKNIFDVKVDIQRMKKVSNNDMNQAFILCEKIINNKNEKNNNNNNNKIINNNNDEDEKLQRMKEKKKEIEDAINNRYNRYIEIMNNNRDKKYINLQYLDLMEDFIKRYGKYKIEYYLVKNDRFKDVLIPAECIKNYMRYKQEYEKKQFVLINLNNKKNEVQYLVNLKDLKKLYDGWTDLKKIQEIDTENPQFEGKTIDLNKASVVDIGQIKELPEQPDLNKKMKEYIDLESLKIYEQYSDIYKNVKNQDYITIRRVIKKRKKKEKKK